MAMTYQNFASLGVNLNRQKYGPLDISNVFTSAADLKYYLTKGTFTEGVSEYWYKSASEKVVPYPYEGQILATVIDGVVNVYALSLDAEGNFQTQEIAGKIEVDGKTIKLNADGKLELVGIPADITGKTLVPSLVNGELTWAEPDTSTAEGQAQEIEGLKTRATALEATVNGTGEGESRVPGLVEKVVANTQAIADQATDFQGKLEAAVAEVKKYADDNDSDTIYDDTDVKARIKAIEDDYLKGVDKYDDTELARRVSAIESDYLKSADKYDDTALANRVKALEDEERYDDTALQTRVGTLETASADHETRIGKVEEFFQTADGESLAEAMDTLIEIQKEIASDNEGAAAMLASIEANTTAITKLNGDAAVEGSVDKKIADAVAPLATTQALNEVKATAEAAQTAEEVEAAIEAAFTDANLAQYAKDADVVKKTDFETFKGENTTAIGTAKSEAIAAAAKAVEDAGYAVAADVAETYATKDELTEAVEGIENDLLAYAKTADVNAELAKKIETGSIAHSSETLTEGVTVDGTKLNIVVDAYTKQEVRDYVADVIEDMTGGESAADVLLALNNHIDTYTEKVGQIDAKDAAQDTAIAAAKTQADKGVADADKVATDLAALDTRVVSNTNEIGAVKGTITTVNETLSGKITALENKDIELAGLITGLDTAVKGNATTIGQHTASISALEAKDTELAGQISAVDKKFENYYDKDTVDTKVQEAIDAIPDVDFTPYATNEYVNAELAKKADASAVYTKDEADAAFMNQDEVDARINALIVAADPEGGKTITDIQNLVKYVDENAGEIAALITETDSNTAKLAGIDTTVKGYVDSAISALVMPKASTEVTIAEDGTLGLGQVSTDKLVQGQETLVLFGGDATI